jgi:hypothetical protein
VEDVETGAGVEAPNTKDAVEDAAKLNSVGGEVGKAEGLNAGEADGSEGTNVNADGYVD